MSIDAPDKTAVSAQTLETAPRFSRALLALTAAATMVAAPIAAPAFALAGSGRSAHSSPVYLLAQASHDIGHNDWAFQGGVAGRIDWVVSYVALGLFWLVIALWIRVRARRAEAIGGSRRRRLWRRVLAAAWITQTVTGLLTLGAGLIAAWTSSALGPAVLRAADLCSPWWSCVAVLIVVANAELNAVAFRAAIGYGALLAVLLLVPLPGPDAVKVLVLSVAAAAPALLATDPPIPVRQAAAAAD